MANTMKTFQLAYRREHIRSRALFMLCLLISGLLSLSVSTSVASAATYYLDKNASGANNGTSWTDAWETIQDAYNGRNGTRPSEGDTVLIQDGSYGDFSSPDDGTIAHPDNPSWSDYCTWQADTGQTNVVFNRIKFGGGATKRTGWQKFVGIKIGPGSTYLGYIHYTDRVWFDNCTFAGNGYNESDGTPIAVWFDNSDYCQVTNCTFDGVGSTPNACCKYGIKTNDANNFTVSGCTITECGVGIFLDGSNGTINDNTLHGLTSDGILFVSAPGLVVSDNTVYDVFRMVLLSDSSGATYVDSTKTITADSGTPYSTVVANDYAAVTHAGGTTLRKQIASVGGGGSTIVLKIGYGSDYNPVTKVEIFANIHVDGIQGWSVNGDTECDNVTIQRNRVYNIEHQGLLCNAFAAAGTPTTWTIENNLFHDIPMYGESASTIALSEVDDVTFRNNIITSPSNGGYIRLNGGDLTNFSGNIINLFSLYYTDPTFAPTNIVHENHNIINNWGAWMIGHTTGANTTILNNQTSFESLFNDYSNSDFSPKPNSLTIDYCSSTYTPNLDQNGRSRVDILLVGNDGSDYADAGCYEYVSADPNNSAPVLESIGSKSVNENAILTFTVSATDADSDTITYSATSLPSGATFSNQTFSWTPGYDQAGSHEVTFIASDGQTQDSETITITVNNVNRAPVLDAIGDKSANENNALSFSVSASDADNDTITYSAESLPSGAAFASQNFTWTPSYEQAGTYQVTFVASDTQAQDSETMTITVNNTNRPPVLTSIGNKSVNENSALSFSVSAADADSDTITYSAQNLPSGASFASQNFSWTPSYEQTGTYQVTFVASDTQAQDSETITITVNNINRAPVLDTIGDKSANENSTLSFSISASDADNDTIIYSVGSLPSGAAFVSQSFTWTPSYEQTGTYQVTFVASDDSQAQDSETITITVNNVNRTPVLSTIGNQSICAGDSLTFTVNATDPDGDTVTYSVQGLPSGATFTNQTFNWTPNDGQVGSYVVTFIASDGNAQDSESITITVSADVSAPSVTNCSPDANAIQTPTNTLIILHIVDTDKGVDANSVIIKVSNNTVYTGNTSDYSSGYGHCYRVGTEADYTFIYQANDTFDFDQTITVTVNATDTAGNAMSEHSYSFKTEMRSFSENKKVNSDSDNSSDGTPSTIRGSNGDIWAAWHAGQAGSRDVYIGKLTAGADNFGGRVQLTSNGADQYNAAIAIDADDKLYVVWQDNRGETWDIYISTSVDGTTWSTERPVTDANANQTNPAIVIDGSSPKNAYVVWQDDRAGNQDVYVASSSNDFVTKTVSQITSDSSDQTEPAVAADSDNTIYVVWTDARGGSNNIYGAASNSGPWTNVAIVNNANNQSSPAIAAEAAGSILHLLWVDDTSGNRDIYYASSNGLPSSPLTGSTIIDDTSRADQLEPAIAVTGSTGNNLKIFACWQDERNSDTDLYFVEVGSSDRTNVLIGDDDTNVNQSEPATGVDIYGHPYIVWVDSRNTSTDIYYAGSTFIESNALASENVSTSLDTTIGTEPANISNVDDVSIIVPAGAYSCDIEITISRVKNPSKFVLERFSLPYEFGPSGINFNQPVTITIPYEVSSSGNATSAYWYNPLTGTLSQQGITDIENIEISPTLYALRFKTTHLTQFFVGGSIASILGSGGGGGGCAISPDSQGNIAEFLLPYAGYIVVLIAIKYRDTRKRRACNTARSER